jgi:gamma-glutamylcyclotransferase (GGCT)/AIG2-like uncharacterized protein YtfP
MEFTCRGRVELTDVYFYVTAETAEEAKEKLKSGDWDFYEIDRAECLNAMPNVLTVTVNE